MYSQKHILLTQVGVKGMNAIHTLSLEMTED